MDKKIKFKKLLYDDFITLTTYEPNTIYLVNKSNTVSIYVSENTTNSTIVRSIKKNSYGGNITNPTISLSSATNVKGNRFTLPVNINNFGSYNNCYIRVKYIADNITYYTDWLYITSTGTYNIVVGNLKANTQYIVSVEVFTPNLPIYTTSSMTVTTTNLTLDNNVNENIVLEESKQTYIQNDTLNLANNVNIIFKDNSYINYTIDYNNNNYILPDPITASITLAANNTYYTSDDEWYFENNVHVTFSENSNIRFN